MGFVTRTALRAGVGADPKDIREIADVVGTVDPY
jgi:hypothetical protein